jgi:hypothetical protein
MVMMSVWPTDAADGSVASEARWRKMARTWAPSGVVAGQGGEMAPSLAGTNLTVRSGACWVDGHYCELGGDQVLTVTANGLAVVRFDPAANSAELIYRDGATTPNQNPTGTWEQPIAKLAGSALSDQRGRLIDPAAGNIYPQRFTWGQQALTANQDGRATLTHNLGVIPSTILITIYNGGASPVRTVDVQDLNWGAPNGCAVQMRDGAGNPSPAGTAVTVFWTAMA